MKIFGFRLGVATVLFVGLAFSTMEPDITVPPLIYIVGLALGAIVSTTALAWLLIQISDLEPATGAGMLTGALTNTPAMAVVVDSLPALIDVNPLGVLVVILTIAIFGAIMKVDHQ